MQFFPGVQSRPAPFMNAHGVFEAAENKAGEEFSDVLYAHLEQPVTDREPLPVEAQRPQESQRAPLVSGEETTGVAAEREAAEAFPHDGAKGEAVRPGEERPHGRTEGGEAARPEKAAAEGSAAQEPGGKKEAVAASPEPEKVEAAEPRAGDGKELSVAAVEVELERVLEVASDVARSQVSQDVRARVEAKVEALHDLLRQFRQSAPKERAELAATLGERVKALKEELASVARQEVAGAAAQAEASVSRRAARAVGQLELLSQRLAEAGQAAQAVAAASAREPKLAAGTTAAGAVADAVKETRQSASAKKTASREVPEAGGGAAPARTGGTEGKAEAEPAPVARRKETREQTVAKQDTPRRGVEQKNFESGQAASAESRPEPEAAASDPKTSRPKDSQVPEVRGSEGGKASKASADAAAAISARIVPARDAEQAPVKAPESERQTGEQGARTAHASSDVKGGQTRHEAKDGFFGASTREKSAPAKTQTSGAGKIVPEGESAAQTAAQSAPSTASVRAEAATSVRNAEVYQQIENGAFKNLGQGLRQLVIRLDPADLGQVSVILQVRGKEVQAVLRAGNQETSQILNEQLGQLRTQLEAQGLKVGKLEVQTQLADSQSQSQWQGAEQHNRYQENRELALSAQRWRTLERLDGDLVRDVQNTPQREKLSQSGLDIFA